VYLLENGSHRDATGSSRPSSRGGACEIKIGWKKCQHCANELKMGKTWANMQPFVFAVECRIGQCFQIEVLQ
jgi:hypothetical protein